jgi:3-hydroxyisobutyrate dehydrogenase-like beta-hydroxyacid dehydrogenase
MRALAGVDRPTNSPVRTKPETATAIKLANNMVSGAVIVAQAKAFSLLRKYGVAPQVMFEVMN